MLLPTYSTHFKYGFNIEEENTSLQFDFTVVKSWFFENYMVLNAGKCHYMCIGNDTESREFVFEDITMKNTTEVKMLGITIDSKLNFNSHIKTLCVKASQKIGALSRLSNYLNKDEKSLIFNSMIKSHFSYCPLVWMFCSRTSNNMINRLHERSLRIVNDDENSDFKSLLEMNNEVSIHHRNLQVLMTELYKIKQNISVPIMENMFQVRENKYNLRHFQEFETERKRTINYSIESLSYRGPQLWSILPNNLKEVVSLNLFKTNIKNWICSECPCRLCKTFIQNLGFIN